MTESLLSSQTWFFFIFSHIKLENWCCAFLQLNDRDDSAMRTRFDKIKREMVEEEDMKIFCSSILWEIELARKNFYIRKREEENSYENYISFVDELLKEIFCQDDEKSLKIFL